MDEYRGLSSTEDVQPSVEESAISYSLLNPIKIGRYTLLRRIGKGGFGQVILAFEPRATSVQRPVDPRRLGGDDRFLILSRDPPNSPFGEPTNPDKAAGVCRC
jgi:hypothetical protein